MMTMGEIALLLSFENGTSFQDNRSRYFCRADFSWNLWKSRGGDDVHKR